MDKKATFFVSQAVEHLFQTTEAQRGLPDHLQLCERLLRAVWRQLAAVSGPAAAAALIGYAIHETSSDWPLIGQVKVTDGGIDTSALRQACRAPGCEDAGAACKSLVQNCLSMVVTLLREDLALTLVDRVEVEMRELRVQPEADAHAHARNTDRLAA